MIMTSARPSARTRAAISAMIPRAPRFPPA